MPSGIYPRTLEQNRKISETLFGRILPNWHKEKIRNTLLGQKHTKIRCLRISKALKGIRRNDEFKIKISKAFSGANHPNWQGGKSYEIYPLGWNRTYKEQIRRRDEYKCQKCGVPETELRRRLCVHHKNLNKKDINSDNLISLCLPCHIHLHWQITKESWWAKD